MENGLVLRTNCTMRAPSPPPDIDNCAFKPCKNGGTCTDKVDGFICTCTAGFKGANCEGKIDTKDLIHALYKSCRCNFITLSACHNIKYMIMYGYFS